MPRDYKRKSKASADPSPWRWLAAGFGLGMIAAVMLYQHFKPQLISNQEASTQESHSSGVGNPDPQSMRADDATLTRPPAEKSNDESASSEKTTASTRNELKTLPLPGTPDYDFYKMLPNFEVVVADVEPAGKNIQGKPAGAQKPIATDAKDRLHFLQAGSFRKFTDADRRKAQLALSGVESNIHQVTIEGNIWFRVYVGPTRDLARLDRARTTLAYADIETMLIRVKQ